MKCNPEYKKSFLTMLRIHFYKIIKFERTENMQTNEAFILRNIYGKYILMPMRSNNTSNDPILLNEVAAFIWKAALNQQEYKVILENVSQSYNLKSDSPEMIAVKQFIAQMVTMGLIKISHEEE